MISSGRLAHFVIGITLTLFWCAGCTGTSSETPQVTETVQEISTTVSVPTSTLTPSPQATEVLPTQPPLTPTDPATATPIPSSPPLDPPGMEVLARLNAWRIQNGLWPLKANPILTQMATDQAEFVANLPVIPEGAGIHVDRNGNLPQIRAIDYGWPSYGEPARDRMAITEIAGIGSIDFAFSFWEGSEVHRKSALSGQFREVGIGIVSHPFGSIFIVVLGSRPNIFPALIDQSEGKLYLSAEQYRWARAAGSVSSTVHYDLLSGPDKVPADAEWKDWTPFIPLPEQPGPYVLAFSDGEHAGTILVDPEIDIAWLPATPMPTE